MEWEEKLPHEERPRHANSGTIIHRIEKVWNKTKTEKRNQRKVHSSAFDSFFFFFFFTPFTIHLQYPKDTLTFLLLLLHDQQL